MSLSCTSCKNQPNTPLWCKNCQQICCISCAAEHNEHKKQLTFLCQQCEQGPQHAKTVFCENCEQHLCEKCSQKIHNKGKRAKHTRYATSNETLQTRTVYIVCQDVLDYYGFINYGSMLMEISDRATSGIAEVVIVEKQKAKQIGSNNKTNMIIQQFNAEKQFDEDYCHGLKSHYPGITTILFVQTQKSFKYYEIAKKSKSCKVEMVQLGEPVKKTQPTIKLSQISASSVSIAHSSFKNKSNISAKYPQETRNYLSINMSTSTQNSLRKRKRKAPILYFHPYVTPKGDKRSIIQQNYRQLASNGILMTKRNQCKEFDDIVLRSFMRNIGEKEVEYVSLMIDSVSVECLYWVIRSIEEDRIAPTQKLILSRLKQSFDIKVHSKLWHYVLDYLSSHQYDQDRRENDRMSEVPKLLVKSFNNQDNYILYCHEDEKTPVVWEYEDLGTLDEKETAWKQFLQLINDYFAKNTQIGGGRYGCVQFIKFNAIPPLKNCSLGKLSLFVQQAINKGIIRYHKTLLVSNKDHSQSQKTQKQSKGALSLVQLQKKIKINTLQLLLIDNFMQYGPGVPLSLAQIPQNLRKNCHFDINYIQLGFPKLKNLLTTLSQLINIELSKCSIVYSHKQQTLVLVQQKRKQLCADTDLLLKSVLDELLNIIDGCNLSGVAMQELFYQLTQRTGLKLDLNLFQTNDFYGFLNYYGQNYFDIQIHMGYFIVYKKRKQKVEKNPPQTLTPTFKQNYQVQALKNLQHHNWEANFLVQSISTKVDDKQEEEEKEQNQSQSFSDYKSIYDLIDDYESESQSYPKTVIVKQGSFNTVQNQMYLTKQGPIVESSNCSATGQFQDVSLGQQDPNKMKNNKAHYRMYSNNTQQRTNHFRVYSNMSRD